MYHLPISRFYVENQGIVLNEYLRFPLVPQNMQMLFYVRIDDRRGRGSPRNGYYSYIHHKSWIDRVRTLASWIYPSRILVDNASSLSSLPIRENLGYAYIDDGAGVV